MKSRRQDFVLGLVVLVFLGLFVGTMLFVYPRLGVHTKKITVRFRHEDGVAPLKQGSAVMLSGALQVGKVSRVWMDSDEVRGPGGQRIKDLMIYVEADVDTKLELHEGCRLTTDQPPVGGGGVLVILDVGPSDAPPAPRTIDGLPPQSLAAAIGSLTRRLLGPGGMVDKLEQMVDANAEGSLAYQISQSLGDINAITATLKRDLSPGERDSLASEIHAVVGNIRQTTASLRDQLSTEDEATLLSKVHVVLSHLDAGLTEANAILAESRPPLRDTLSNVAAASAKVNADLLPAVLAEFNRDDPAALMGQLHAGLSELNAALGNVRTMTEEGRKMVILNRPLLDRTIANFKQASDRANALVLELVLHPWRLFKPPAGEIKKHDAFVAAQFFAEAAVQLNDAVARLEAIEQATAPGEPLQGSEEEIRAIQQSLRQTFQRFREAENYLWQQMK